MEVETISLSRDLYYQMLLVRRFEERILELFSQGELYGTTHAYIGQEANAVAVLNNISQKDIVVSNHRCHGHYLVHTGDVVGLMAELMGREGGVCGGRGGSQHLCSQGFYTNGVQGNMTPVAAGMAFAEKQKSEGNIVVLFLGDGTFGEGIVYETFNMVSLWNIPLVVVVENNQYAQTTPLQENFAGSFVERARAFNIQANEIESNDVEVLYERFKKVIGNVRESQCPHVEVIHTYRLCAHSKGDDCRTDEEINTWRERDPINIQGARISMSICSELEKVIQLELDAAESKAKEMGFQTSLT